MPPSFNNHNPFYTPNDFVLLGPGSEYHTSMDTTMNATMNANVNMSMVPADTSVGPPPAALGLALDIKPEIEPHMPTSSAPAPKKRRAAQDGPTKRRKRVTAPSAASAATTSPSASAAATRSSDDGIPFDPNTDNEPNTHFKITRPKAKVKANLDTNTSASASTTPTTAKGPVTAGIWTPEKRAALTERILASGIAALSYDAVSAEIGLSPTQLKNALQRGRAGNLRDKIVKAIAADKGETVA